MSVIVFPGTARAAIDAPAEVSSLEAMICGIAGVVCARGGMVALAGRDLHATSIPARIATLSQMYAQGEVVIGYGEPGETINIVIEKLRRRGAAQPSWRAEIFAETPEGHALRATLKTQDVDALCDALLRGASGGFDPLGEAGAAVLNLARA